MKFIINLVSKITGIDAMTKALDGQNTKLAGVAAVLTGVAGLVMTWVGMPHDMATIIHFVQGLPKDPSVLAIIGGWTALGLGRKMDKASGQLPSEPLKP